jgi:hypothetical protein
MKDNDSIDISQDAWGEILATIKEVSDRIADLTIEHELDPRVAVAVAGAITGMVNQFAEPCTCNGCLTATMMLVDAFLTDLGQIDVDLDTLIPKGRA